MLRAAWSERRPRDGRDGADAEPVDEQRIADAVFARVPRPRDGRDGIDGRDADPEQVRRDVDAAVALIPAPKDGARGPRGPKGDDGATGPAPRHEWKETELRFERPDGSWGRFVDLRGPPGFTGFVGGDGSGSAPFDFNSLPIGDDSTPEEIAVKQNGVWVRITWSQFRTLIGNPLGTGLALDGADLTLDGDALDLI